MGLTALLSLENTFTSEDEPYQVYIMYSYGENSSRRKFLTAKGFYSENSERRKTPYGEISVRPKLHSSKKLRAKNPTAKNLTAKIPSAVYDVNQLTKIF